MQKERRKMPHTVAQKTRYWTGRVMRLLSVAFVLGVIGMSLLTAAHKNAAPAYSVPTTSYQPASMHK